MKLPGPILLVDDEPHIRKFVGLILKQLGYASLLEAGNGEEAVAVCQREHPALVLMDVNMPVMDGIQALKKIRELDDQCVVVMLTSLANRLSVEEALEHGAADYLRKDTPKDEIAAALKETIEAHFDANPDS